MEVIKREIDKRGSVANPFPCTMCPKSFVHKNSLEEHIFNKHVDNKEFQCTDCFETKQLTKYFATQQLLNQHIKRVHSPSNFNCQVCFKTFNHSLNLLRHKRTHSQANNIKRYKCDLCSKDFRVKYYLQCHLFAVHKKKREGFKYFKCELCSREFFERFKLENHVVKVHVVDKAFECLVCSKKFIDQQTLETHMKRHDTKLKYFCDVCSRGFKVRKSLINHLGVEHKKFFYCDKKCLRSFKNKPEFDAHISDAKQELKCYMCQELLYSECNLKIHIDSHVKAIKTENKVVQIQNRIEPSETNEVIKQVESTKDLNLEKITCELCFKTFDRQAYFTAHRRELHSNAEWKCNFEQCSKIFKWYSQFKLHKMMHSETKEYVCSVCGKSFYRPDSLKYHERTHIADKAYQCDMCPKSFNSLFPLRTHIANNHGGCKPFKCTFVNCETSWASNSLLRDHLVSHQTERSFICEMCTTVKAFKSRKQLRYHERAVHLDTKKRKNKERK